MNRTMKKVWLIFTVLFILVIANHFLGDINNAYGRKSKNSRSFRTSSSVWKRSSSPSKSVWGSRNGGGIYGSKKSTYNSGYKKVPAKKTSGSYTKTYSKSNSKSKPKVQKKASSDYNKLTKAQVQKKSSSDYNKLAKTQVQQANFSGKLSSDKKKTQIGKSSSGYNKPAERQEQKTSFFLQSSFDKKKTQMMKKEKAASSLASYKKERSKFQQPKISTSSKSYSSNPIYQNSKSYSDFDYRTYYSQRDDYYRSHNWQAPSYVYRSSPRFGMWDAMVWWMVLDNLSDRRYYSMAHHHQNDPGYQEWRKEADRLAQSNKELKNKLAKMDQQVQTLKGQPQKADYLPDDLPSEVALAADVMAQKEKVKPEFRLATASKTGNYHYFGTLLKQYSSGINVNTINTQGSMENIKRLMNNEIDGAIVQSDAFTIYRKKFPNSKIISSEQTMLYIEAIQMIANTKSGVKTIKDIKPNGKHILYIGPPSSGTALTWEGLCNQDEWYRKIKVENADYQTALKEVIKNPKAIMMFVSGLNSELLKKAEQEAKANQTIRLVEIDDWDFNDARDEFWNRIYKFVSIPSSVYPNLQKGFFFDRDVETIAVDALLIVRTDWMTKYGPEAMDALSFAVMETQPLITRHVNGLQ